MTRRLFMCLLFVLLTAPAALRAQSDTPWEVIVATDNGDAWQITRITPEGLDAPIPLPTDLFLFGSLVERIEVSTGLRYAAVSQYSRVDFTPFDIRYADLKTGAVTRFSIPGQRQDPASIAISGFDPSGTRFAVTAVYDQLATNGTFSGVFGVVDAIAGTFTDYTAQVESAGMETYVPGWYMLGDWDELGIHMHANCYGCEPPFEGTYSAFDPDTGAFTADTGVAFSIFAEQLPMTGELFARSYSTNYPFSTEATAYFPIQNILVYMPSTDYLPTFGSQSGEHEASAESPVIYNNPQVVDLEGTQFEWIADGQAVIAAVGNTWTLLNRAGGITTMTAPLSAIQIVGTPDGFIALDEDWNVRHFTLPGLQPDFLGTVSGSAQLRVLSSTPLGESADPVPAAFTPIQPNFAQLEAIMLANQRTCPGFMPSRLFPGQQGRVTPGAANRLRSAPATTAQIVGQIPGGATFDVLSGPECGENTAWWYVHYDGLYGYTAEGMGGEYFVELVRP